MHERNKSADIEQTRLFDIGQLCLYIGMGKNNARKLAEDANAVRRFGKSVRYDRRVIDDYLDTLKNVML